MTRTQPKAKKVTSWLTFNPQNPTPLTSDSPCGAWFDAQHVPRVLAVTDASDGVGLLLGEADADLSHRTLAAVLAHVGDGREERLGRKHVSLHQSQITTSRWVSEWVSVHLKHLIDALSALRRRFKVMEAPGLCPQTPLPLIHHPPLCQVHLHGEEDARHVNRN